MNWNCRAKTHVLSFSCACAVLSACVCEGAVERSRPDGARVVVSGKVGVVGLQYDPVTELMAIVCRLAGYREYNKKPFDATYAAEVDKWFGPFADEPLVECLRGLKSKLSIGYNAPSDLAVHLKPDLSGFVVPLDPWPQSLDDRWRPMKDKLPKLVAMLADFRVKTKFDDFYDAHRDAYAADMKIAMEALRKMKLVDWLESFYGPQGTKNRYRWSICRMVFPHNHGCSVRVSPDQTLYTPVMAVNCACVLPHEFSHGFVNPIARKILKELPRDGAAYRNLSQAYERVKDKMKRQAYGSLEIYWLESYNRACELRYWLSHDQQEARRMAEEYVQRGFGLSVPLVKLLARYEKDRTTYPSLVDFSGEVVKLLEIGEKYATR